MTASRPPARPLLVLRSERLRPYVERPGPFAVAELPDWERLFAAVERAPPSAVVLVDACPGGGEPDPRLFRLLGRYPSATVVAALEIVPGAVGHARALLAAGASELLGLGREPPETAARVLASAHARPLKRRLEAALSRFTSAEARVLLRAAAEVAADGGSVPDLAARLGVSEQTLGRWCEAAALPGPRRLQVWMRLLLAALLLEDGGRTLRAAAAACGYATDRSLRRALGALLGAGSRELRREGAFERTAAGFNAELRSRREDVRRAPPRAARARPDGPA
ncbi:MAG TPA: helix-turn-helix domain-containing protein [Longimicrobium sp.]|jgi:AraC-like DNA-binding protein